jgi:hypothetical protein
MEPAAKPIKIRVTISIMPPNIPLNPIRGGKRRLKSPSPAPSRFKVKKQFTVPIQLAKGLAL